MAHDTPTAIRTCPACGGANTADAAFCVDTDCHKALGEFAYVGEAIAARLNWIQRLADRVASWAGHPHFVTVHLLWFIAWTSINSAAFGARWVFDAYPYGLLGIVLAVEAALITSLLLIGNRHQRQFEAKRAELEYEANIASFRLLRELHSEVRALGARVHALDRRP